jgi:hypothetical protein
MGTKANYLAGSLVANAIVWIGTILNPYDKKDMLISYITVYFIVSIIGGALGGYLVARRSLAFSSLRLGVVLGALSYAILAISDIFLGVEAWIDSLALIGFAAGFTIGARMIELRRTEMLKKRTQ